MAAGSVPQALYPESQWATYSGITASWAMFTPSVTRSLAFRRFGSDRIRYRRALRVLTLSDVFGYPLASHTGAVNFFCRLAFEKYV